MADGDTLNLSTASQAATEALGHALGEQLQAGDVVALIGELGAGKTAFVRGLARGLRVDPDEVASPTFTLVAEYRGRLPLYHVDLYRLAPGAADEVPLREYAYGTGVTAIEWFDRLPSGALDAYLLVRIDYAGSGRRISFAGHGARAVRLVEGLRPPRDVVGP